MLETFQWTPEPGSSVSYSHRNLVAKFGDGYEQITGDGINTAVDSWSLTFTENTAVIEQIQAFIDRHKERKPFLWKPPGKSSALTYKGHGVQVTYKGGYAATLSVTFTRVYRLLG